MTFTISPPCLFYSLHANTGVEWLIGWFIMLTGFLGLPSLPSPLRKTHNPSSVPWGCVSLCCFNILCPLLRQRLKHLLAYWSCAWWCSLEGPPSQSQTQRHQSPDPGCLYYVSSCCGICLCYSECMYITARSSNLGSPSTKIIHRPSEVLTTLEVITWNCPRFKDFICSKSVMTSRSV